jgi:3-dehydroquinate synthase
VQNYNLFSIIPLFLEKKMYLYHSKLIKMELPYFETKAITNLTNYIEGCKKKHQNNVILCDTHTYKHCLPLLERMIPFPFVDKICTIPCGEEHKTIETVIELWQQLLNQNSDKNTVLICLGGGIVCDLGGFVAATFKRGIEHIVVPTSLMAQVDAAIGGKTAVNLHNAKNQIGLFHPANATFIIPDFLKTLPDHEIVSGFAEMLKHGLIADKSYWNELIILKNTSQIINPALINTAVTIKLNICKIDPYDKGERKKLNFGHSIGHALESLALSQQKPLSHGEAVAMGMVAETYLSYQKKLISATELDVITNSIRRFFPVFPLDESDYTTILYYLYHDKKRQHDNLNFTLLHAIGSAVIDQQVSRKQIVEALNYIHL